jgi:hypothetical protein
MPTFGAHFSDDESTIVEAAAKAAGQKLAPYIADAVRARMQREGMLPATQVAEALAEARDLIAAIGPVEFRRLINLTRENAVATCFATTPAKAI